VFTIKKRIVSLYEIFNVSEEASPVEIKREYKKLAIEYHPDKLESQNDPELKSRAEHELIKINNAKDILLDPIKRADYDKILRDLRSKTNVTTDELIVEISDNETINIEWDLESFSEEPEPEEAPDFMIKSDKTEAIHHPAPIEEPREPAPDFSTIRRRFLTFCPRCGEENLSGKPFCLICNCSLVDAPGQISSQVTIVPPIHAPSKVTAPVPEPIAKPPWRLYCPRCRTENLKGRDFCIACNANLKSVQEEEQDELGYFICPHCGSENSKSSGICSSCYKDLTFHEDSVTFSVNNYFQATEQETSTDDKLRAQSNGVRQCPNCGAENGFEREYCHNCNMNLKYYREIIPPRKSVNQPDIGYPQRIELQECPHCGNRNRIESRFCGSCYKNLDNNQNPE
jgi:hypothetical protein